MFLRSLCVDQGPESAEAAADADVDNDTPGADEAAAESRTLYIKNLAFATNEEGLQVSDSLSQKAHHEADFAVILALPVICTAAFCRGIPRAVMYAKIRSC